MTPKGRPIDSSSWFTAAAANQLHWHCQLVPSEQQFSTLSIGAFSSVDPPRPTPSFSSSSSSSPHPDIYCTKKRLGQPTSRYPQLDHRRLTLNASADSAHTLLRSAQLALAITLPPPPSLSAYLYTKYCTFPLRLFASLV